MPSLGFGEIIVIVLFALVFFGPKRLPEIGRAIGRSLREFRRASSDLRKELEGDVDDRPRFPNDKGPPPRPDVTVPPPDRAAGDGEGSAPREDTP